MKFAISAVIFFSFFTGLHAQSISKYIDDNIKEMQDYDSLIIWNQNKKLCINDFLGKPDYNSPANAITCYNIIPVYEYIPKIITHSICYFDKSKSWIKKEISDSLTIIHEQGHFDLAEVFARKMDLEISKIHGETDSIDLKIDIIREKIYSELDSAQNKYDEETNHSINKLKQIEWNKKIRAMLKK